LVHGKMHLSMMEVRADGSKECNQEEVNGFGYCR